VLVPRLARPVKQQRNGIQDVATQDAPLIINEQELPTVCATTKDELEPHD
jgi:hypothetical protein